MQNFFTIVDNKNQLPIFWRNHEDPSFFDENSSNSPKKNEMFLTIFTEPWMAFEFMDSSNMINGEIYIIDSQKSWDFFKMVCQGEDVERVVINRCILTNNLHERLFPIISLKNQNDFAKFSNLIQNTETCKVCYDQDRFLKDNTDQRVTLAKHNYD